MRNLKLLEHHLVSDATELSGTQCLSIDYDTGVVYCATASSIIGLDPNSQQVVSEVNLSVGGHLNDDGSCHVVGLQHLPDQMSVCVATSQGDVLLWNTSSGQVECVGSVDSGLAAMSWSPDQELLLLATGQETLIMMTREFDPVTEISIHSSEFGEAEFVTVGWGKKETQFHGSEGKQAAQKKQEEVKPAFPWDDRLPRISWRGDGQFFAVSSLNQGSGARQVRVWTRECVLHSTSENVDGIEQCLAWKPSGSLIATSLRRPNKHEIAFFEKNGLRHGEFTLPFGVQDIQVKEILWNTESTILAVWCENLPRKEEDNVNVPLKSYVQLWTTSNYHWYLKQSLEFPATEGSAVAAVAWDQEHAYRMHVVCHGGRYLQYTWSWCIDHSLGTSCDDMATVAVIDGDKVLMTPFRKMVVPPPMSAYQLQMAVPVSQVVFASPSHSNDMAVVLCDGTLAFYHFVKNGNSSSKRDNSSVKVAAAGGNGFMVQCDIPVEQGIYSIEGDVPDHLGAFPLKLSHFLWLGKDKMVFTTLNMMGSESCLCEANVDHDSRKFLVKNCIEVGGFVYKIASTHLLDMVVLQLKDGTLLKYSLEDGSVSPWLSETEQPISFPQPCTRMEVCTIGGKEVVLGLTERFRCYANDVEVASNCTSFAVHEEFLLLTTLSHTCRCICRKTSLQMLPTLSDGKAHPFDESIRRVERGSRIIHVVPDDTAVVLQMPRGNLEVIHPRALVLSSVRKNLDRLHYKDAFVSMRKHRINMNLIYDHDPQKFLENVRLFIEQVENPSHVNLFLSDLQEEDVTITMYTASYNRSNPPGGSTSKVDKVCTAVQKTLEKMDSNKYLLSILTAYVKKSKPELSTALLRVKSLKDQDKSLAEEALKYLLFLVDVNELYDVALGTYDFDLVLMVAEKSQKDPKEYLPFLNNLRRLEKNYQQYTIDRHLKCYSSALEHISKCGTEKFPECLSLVKEHRLYSQALSLFPRTSPEYKEIAEAYGEYLTGRKYHEEAGLIYMRADLWQPALEAFTSSLNWRQALCAACQLSYTQEAISVLARSLGDKLKDNRRHEEAACLYEQYANDVEEAIVCLIDGAAWDEALRMMYKHSRTDFIDTHLVSALEENHGSQMAFVEDSRTEFERHVNRLSLVREAKVKAMLGYMEGGCHDDADLFSDTSSATGESLHSSRYSTTDSQHSTVFSKSSGRSSKNRRKMERKKYSLKEGSQFEDLALVEALSKIISQTHQLTGEIRLLLSALVLFHLDEKAETLQASFADFLSAIDAAIPDIWDANQKTSEQTPTFGPQATANYIALAMQQGKTPQSQPELDPVLRNPPQVQKDSKWQLHILGGSLNKLK